MLFSEPLVLFAALCFIGVAIGGACAYVIFWPLSLIHLRDNHPEVRASLGDAAFLKPSAVCWLMRGEYRSVQDRTFTGLATPARIAAAVTAFALLVSAVLWAWAVLTA